MASKPPHWNWKASRAIQGPGSPSRNIRGLPLRDFHRFHELPLELQRLIWLWACRNKPVVFQLHLTRYECEIRGPLPGAHPIMLATSGARAIALENFRLLENTHLQRELPSVLHILPAALLTQIFAGAGPLFPLALPWPQHHLPTLLPAIMGPRQNRFYANLGGDIFKVELAHTPQSYHYPFACVGNNPLYTISTPRQNAHLQINFITARYQPPEFSLGAGPVPEYFNDIARIAMDFKLPARIAGHTLRQNSIEYTRRAVVFFWPQLMKRVAKFPNLERVDLVIPALPAGFPNSMMTRLDPILNGAELCTWRDVPLMKTDGLSFGSIEMNLLERELYLWATAANQDRERLAGDNKEKFTQFPVVELMIALPRTLAHMKDSVIEELLDDFQE